jgi:hypothetical protein
MILEVCGLKVGNIRGNIQKFPDWVDKRNKQQQQQQTLIQKQHKGLWRQNSLDWLIK